MNYKKIINNLKNHLIDTTAILAEGTPISAAVEVSSGMSVSASMNTRILMAGLNYCGLGYIFSKGRDISRYFFGITNDAPERTQFIHDSLYATMFSLAISPPIYTISQTLSGENLDWYKIGTATASISVASFFNGGPVSYSIDVFRDLTGRKECERPSYPKALKKQSPNIKKVIAVGLIAASIGTMGLIYSLAPTKHLVNARTEKEHALTTERPSHKLEKELYFY